MGVEKRFVFSQCIQSIENAVKGIEVKYQAENAFSQSAQCFSVKWFG
jgi:diacylglycerol kinase